jgi:hypothetical protein
MLQFFKDIFKIGANLPQNREDARIFLSLVCHLDEGKITQEARQRLAILGTELLV